MRYGGRSSRLSPHDAASSSRAPSGARDDPRPGRPPRAEPEDGRQVAPPDHDRRPPARWGRRGPAARCSPRPRRRSSSSSAAAPCSRLSLDDVLGCPREAIPKPTRSALHRCLQRHGISRLPRGEENASRRKRFAGTRPGYVHIDVCELRLTQGKLFLFLAIDRVPKFTHVAFLDATTIARRAIDPFAQRRSTEPSEGPMAPPSCARSWPPSPTGSTPC